MSGRIPYSQLLEKLNNPDVSVDEVRNYFIEKTDPARPFTPRFEIDESKVDLTELRDRDIAEEGAFRDIIVGILNRKHMRRRQRAYERRMRNGWPGLRLVAEGDSWFQYPLRRNDDLIDFLAKPFAVYCLSAAGDELENMLGARNRERIAEILRSTEAHGLLFSGGGNDIAGAEFANFIENAAPSPNGEDYVADSFDRLLDRLRDGFRDFFSDLFGRFPNLRIFVHGYDHALPRPDGKWLGPSLRGKGVPEARWADIVRVMIDRYNAMLSSLAGEFPGTLHHVSCIGAIGSADQWRDELHSKSPGCQRAADRFRSAISAAIPQRGTEAVVAAESALTRRAKASPPAADRPDLTSASEEQLREGRMIPKEDVGLEDVLDGTPASLEVAIAESQTPIPPPNWPADADAPDYAHLDAPPSGSEFEFSGDDLELLIRANHFSPHGHNDVILFGLRGATMASGHQIENAATLVLRDVRPNHLTFQCVMGLHERTTGRLWAYTASTVPNALSMKRYYMGENGLGPAFPANLLPTGCYAFRRASHGWCRSKAAWQVPIALRLTTPGTSNRDAIALVLRNKSGVSYRTDSAWERAIPADNIRPAFATAVFDSAGCLTIRGSNERFATEGSEQWARFQSQIAGMPKNARIDLVLLTGAEAHIASNLRKTGDAGDRDAVRSALERLRIGSSGNQVRKLQELLEVDADGELGPNTQLAVIEKRIAVAKSARADGIYSPNTDELFDARIRVWATR